MAQRHTAARFGSNGLILLTLLVASQQSWAEDPHQSLKTRLKAAGILSDDEWIPMRHGVPLRATVAKPLFGFSASPTVLVRTPYGREELEFVAVPVVLAGYALVVQDMRGRFDSEGEDNVFQDDGWGALQDGYDTVEWIADQSWSNGKIGTLGPSALGIVQGLMAGARPPHLTCQFVTYAASQGYGHAAYQGGAFREALVSGWLQGQDSTHMIPDFRAHTTNDQFWSQYDIQSQIANVNAPAFFIGGFYDCFLQGTLDEFAGRQHLADAGARGNNRLIVGPWTHVNETTAEQGELSYPSASVMPLTDQIELALDWFAFWLKGDDNGVLDGDPVKFYLMGAAGESGEAGNEWRRVPDWPPAHHEAKLYLHGGGSLDATPPGAMGQFTEIVFDPLNPVPTRGGANLEIDAGPFNQRPVEIRGDTIVFTSEPLSAPLEVAGRVRAVIHAAANLEDIDLSVRLSDVYPDGRSMLVCDGVLRAGFRDGFAVHNPIEPGTVYEYEIDLWSTAIAFNTGHRIRVTVANANYPRFNLNPAYGDASVETTIYHDASRPSYVLLPAIAPSPGEHPLLPVDTGVDDWSLYAPADR